MNKIVQIFFKPYPLEDDNLRLLIYNFVISAFVVILLLIFKPFGLDQVKFQMARQLPMYLGYGGVTFLLCLMADFLIKPAFPVFFDDQKWNVAKNILWVIFLMMFIGIGNLFFSNALGFTGISGTALLQYLFYTLVITVLPVVIFTLLTMVSLLKLNLRHAGEVNKTLQGNLLPITGDTNLVFTSETGNELIKLTADQLLYVESADNYSDIVYIDNAIVKRELIKSSLNRIEEANTANFIMRTHRNYMVNLRKVTAVNGNAQGYRLVFNEVEESVPVSKRISVKMLELLNNIYTR